jgi:hypothetical protein
MYFFSRLIEAYGSPEKYWLVRVGLLAADLFNLNFSWQRANGLLVAVEWAAGLVENAPDSKVQQVKGTVAPVWVWLKVVRCDRKYLGEDPLRLFKFFQCVFEFFINKYRNVAVQGK